MFFLEKKEGNQIQHTHLIFPFSFSSLGSILDPSLSFFHSLRSLSPVEKTIHQPLQYTPPSLHQEQSLQPRRGCVRGHVGRRSPTVYTINLLLAALCDSGRLEVAWKVFDEMPNKGCHEFTFAALIRGYCRIGLNLERLEVFERIKGFGNKSHMVICNTLISRFCLEEKVDEAERLVTFNARISALYKAGKVMKSYRILKDMEEEDN